MDGEDSQCENLCCNHSDVQFLMFVLYCWEQGTQLLQKTPSPPVSISTLCSCFLAADTPIFIQGSVLSSKMIL